MMASDQQTDRGGKELSPLGGAHSLAIGLKEKDLAKGFRLVFFGAVSVSIVTRDPAAHRPRNIIQRCYCGRSSALPRLTIARIKISIAAPHRKTYCLCSTQKSVQGTTVSSNRVRVANCAAALAHCKHVHRSSAYVSMRWHNARPCACAPHLENRYQPQLLWSSRHPHFRPSQCPRATRRLRTGSPRLLPRCWPSRPG